MQTVIPKCYNCPNFQGAPSKIGAKAKCRLYTNGVPSSIFFEGRPCPKLSKTKSNKPAKRTTTKSSK